MQKMIGILNRYVLPLGIKIMLYNINNSVVHTVSHFFN